MFPIALSILPHVGLSVTAAKARRSAEIRDSPSRYGDEEGHQVGAAAEVRGAAGRHGGGGSGEEGR